MSEPEKPLAERLFAAHHLHAKLEEAANDALLRCCGIDPDDVDSWPLADITFDWYDSSFEFKAVRPDWVPTKEQILACMALGFSRCWICHTDWSEHCFNQAGEMHFKLRSHRAPPVAAENLTSSPPIRED